MSLCFEDGKIRRKYKEVIMKDPNIYKFFTSFPVIIVLIIIVIIAVIFIAVR